MDLWQILRIGTLWRVAVQGRIDEDAVTEDTALLQDPVLNIENGEVSVNDPNNQPKFIGNHSLSKFFTVLYRNQC